MDKFDFTKGMDYIDQIALDNAIVSAWAIYTVYNTENDFTTFSEYALKTIQEYLNPRG